MTNILQVKDLHTYFYTDTAVAYAVEGASFSVPHGKTVALVGESGCGKTVTALSIMRLVPKPAGEIVKGKIIFKGNNLLDFPEAQMRSIRGRDIAMVFQEPMSSLNPLYTVGYQIQEALLAHPVRNIISNGVHQKLGKSQAYEKTIELLEKVEIPEAKKRYQDYPYNLSGGLRQRVMIAQALACEPALLIADEPTTALDVTIQAQILELFTQLKKESQMSVLLITHDLGVVAEVADIVCIMYAGKVVEEADVFKIFAKAKHPYTEGLLNSIPARSMHREKLSSISGSVPASSDKPKGCPFHPRCYKADRRCREEDPTLLEIGIDHNVSCWKAQ